MSDASSSDTRTLHAVSEPQPLAGLTGAPAAIYTELFGFTEGATVAELALAAGLGRSTASKALGTLEEHGLAVREPGGHVGARRAPDRWTVSRPAAPATPDATPTGTTETPGPEAAPADRPTPDNERQGARPPEQAEPPEAAPSGPKGRLAPGVLRQMVLAHLQAHPGEAFTATRISRVVEKSSGAIANALQKLVSQELAEQVTEQPRTFRLAVAKSKADSE